MRQRVDTSLLWLGHVIDLIHAICHCFSAVGAARFSGELYFDRRRDGHTADWTMGCPFMALTEGSNGSTTPHMSTIGPLRYGSTASTGR